MLHVIEGNDAVIEHEHGIVEADFVAQTLWKAFNQAHHVVAEVADRSSHQRRQTWEPHRAKAFDALAEKGNRIAFFPNDAILGLQDASTIGIAKDFFRVGARKRVARDFFAAL